MNTERSMVDTNVLIYAFRLPKRGDDPRLAEWRSISREILGRMSRIRVCAIAWGEFKRGLRDEETKENRAWFDKIEAEAVDGRVMDRAVDLFKVRGLREKRCDVCNGGMAKTSICDRCKRPRSSKQLLNDAIIIAHAEIADDVDILYCFDGPAITGFRPHIDTNALQIVNLDDPEFKWGPLYREVSQEPPQRPA